MNKRIIITMCITSFILTNLTACVKTPEEKNELLKTVITQVTYLKTEKAIKKDSDPTNFIINLYPKINKANV